MTKKESHKGKQLGQKIYFGNTVEECLLHVISSTIDKRILAPPVGNSLQFPLTVFKYNSLLSEHKAKECKKSLGKLFVLVKPPVEI